MRRPNEVIGERTEDPSWSAALQILDGRYSIHPPQNLWHKVSIDNGVWRNDDGVQWGIRVSLPPVAAALVAKGSKPPPGTFVADDDCVYWQQGQCETQDWAEGCVLHVVSNVTHQVASLRWLGEVYVRDAH